MHPFMVMVAAQLAFAGGQADKEMKTACLMQQKASLDQPLHFSDEADAGAHAEYLRSALVMVKELASNVTTWDTGLSKNERDSLDLIKTFIEDLQKSAANSHDEDQREVMRAKELIADCAKTTRTSIAVNVDPLKTTMEGSREDHDACRTREADCQKKEDDHCQKWESYRKTNVPHECADVDFKNDMKTEVAETKADMEQCLRDLQPFYLKHIPCRQYLECKQGFAPLCDTNQTNFEKDFCAYSRELSGTCEAQINCRRKHIDFRDATHADVATNEKARKADYTTSKKVICYFAVFEGNITNKSAILQGCDKLTVDTTQLDIAYPEIPDAERCDVERSQPCDDDWVSAEYDTKDWKRYVTMLDCAACPAPAPAPTNPPKVPQVPATVPPAGFVQRCPQEQGWTYLIDYFDDRSKNDIPDVGSEVANGFSNSNAYFVGKEYLKTLTASEISICALSSTEGCAGSCTPLASLEMPCVCDAAADLASIEAKAAMMFSGACGALQTNCGVRPMLKFTETVHGDQSGWVQNNPSGKRQLYSRTDVSWHMTGMGVSLAISGATYQFKCFGDNNVEFGWHCPLLSAKKNVDVLQVRVK